jgi:hypothetical protein
VFNYPMIVYKFVVFFIVDYTYGSNGMINLVFLFHTFKFVHFNIVVDWFSMFSFAFVLCNFALGLISSFLFTLCYLFFI